MDVFAALADPTRRAVFERLVRGEQAVGALAAKFRVSQPAISQHLAVLRDAGMVTARQDGRRRLYRVEPAALTPLIDWLAHYREFWNAKLPRLAKLLEELE